MNAKDRMQTAIPLDSCLLETPFEGSPRAAQLIAALQDFLHGELAELAQQHGINHENSASKDLLRQVWKRSHALGFYGMTLPQAMGGEELSVLDQVLIKEAIYASGSPFAPMCWASSAARRA